jgi:hypothetical protein
MAASLPRVLSIPRNDLNDQNQFVLVHVESAGKHPLDLKLVGTDGESVFSVSCKISHTIGHKARILGPQFYALIKKLTFPCYHSKTQSNIFLEGQKVLWQSGTMGSDIVFHSTGLDTK